MDDFLKNKLYVVQSEDARFDSALKNAVNKIWKLSEIGGFISRKELKEMTKSSNNSFLDPTTRYWEESYNSNSGRKATGLYFYQGKPKDPYLRYSINVVYCFAYAKDNFDSVSYASEILVKSAINDFKYYHAKDSIQKKYGLALLKGKKTLLINTKYIYNKKYNLIQKDAFAEYPYKIEYASSEEIEKYIAENNPKYVLAFPVFNDITRQVNMYDLETGFSLGGFQRNGLMGYPIRDKDVEKLVDAINGQ